MAATLLKEEYNPALHASSEPTRGLSAPTLIIGATRSGTSWLGKIFDSHPNVLYRHEPDDVIRLKALPLVCPVEDIPRYVDAAQRYVARLTAVRQIKASGTWPVFAKQFQPFPAPFVRRALVLGVRAAQEVSPAADWPKRIAIPDLISGVRSQISYVVKSVSMLGNAALLAAALPESRIIAVYRHPCGHIASIKRGAVGSHNGPRSVAPDGIGDHPGSRARFHQRTLQSNVGSRLPCLGVGVSACQAVRGDGEAAECTPPAL